MELLKIEKSKIVEYVFYFIASLTFLKPSGIDANGYHQLNDIINLIQIVIILYLFLKQLNTYKQKMSQFLFAEIIFFLVWIFCFWVNGWTIVGISKIMINAIGFEILIEYTVKKGNIDKMIKSFSTMYIILLAVNLYLMVKNYGWSFGWYNSLYDKFSYLESDNGTSGYIMGALLFALLYTRIKNKKISLSIITAILLSILNEVKIWSAATVVGIVLFIIYYLTIQRKKEIKTSALLGAIFFNIGITFFGVHKLFSYIFVTYLNRTVDMTGRIELWDLGINAFKLSPIWGVGEFKYPLDNTLIQVMTQGGLMLLISFLALFFIACKKVSHININNNILYKDVFYTLCIIIVLSTAEAWVNFKAFWIIFSLFVNLRYYRNEQDISYFKRGEII